MSLFIHSIPFCLEIVSIPGTTKAKFLIAIGERSDIVFDLKENTLVGRALYQNGFPLEYQVHPSLKLDDQMRFTCEKLIHRAIAGMLPELFLKMQIPTIQFTPKFPSYVAEEGIILSDHDREFNTPA